MPPPSNNSTPAGEHWRLFAAIPVSADVRRVLASIQDTLRPHRWPLKWVDPKLAHLTLRFYGDTDVALIPRLEARLAEIAASQPALTLTTTAVGAFPSPLRPRVVFLGLEGNTQPLEQLARRVDATATLVGLQLEGKPFKAHITLARTREGGSLPQFRTVVEQLHLEKVSFRVDRVQLIRSVLGRSGPDYTTLAEWPLGAPVAARAEIHEHG